MANFKGGYALKSDVHSTLGFKMRELREVIERAEKLCELCEEHEAKELVLDALERYPNDLELKTELAIILARIDDEDEAENMLREILRAAPCQERAAAALARLLDNSLRTDEAESILLNYIENCGEGHIALEDLCRIWYDQGRIEEALEKAREHAEAFHSTLGAYSALKYLLEILEDDLESDLLDNPGTEGPLNAYAMNLIEQYDVLERMKDCSKSDNSICEDLEAEESRLIGELRALRRRYVSLGVEIPSRLERILAGQQ